MPTYQYVCTTCESPHEAVQGFHDDPLTDCPACDGGRLRKVYGSVGVVFKGSGFYRTDSRSASSSSTPAAPSPAGGAGSDGSSSGGSSTGGSGSAGSSTGGSSTGGSGGSTTGGSGGSTTGSGSAA